MTRAASLAQQPRYQLIKKDILSRIHSGELKPGDRLESENEIGSSYGVSRLTAQRALRELVSEGLVRRVQGSGSFVAPVSSAFSLIEVRDLVEEIRARGGVPRSDVLIQRRCIPPPKVLELLEFADGQEVFQAQIVQLMDDIPVALEERFVHPEVFTDFLEQDFTAASVFRYLSTRSVLGEIENVVSAVLPDRRTGQLLEIAAGEPCILLQRRNWWRGRPITLTRITYAGQRQALASRYKPFGAQRP